MGFNIEQPERVHQNTLLASTILKRVDCERVSSGMSDVLMHPKGHWAGGPRLLAATAVKAVPEANPGQAWKVVLAGNIGKFSRVFPRAAGGLSLQTSCLTDDDFTYFAAGSHEPPGSFFPSDGAFGKASATVTIYHRTDSKLCGVVHEGDLLECC